MLSSTLCRATARSLRARIAGASQDAIVTLSAAGSRSVWTPPGDSDEQPRFQRSSSRREIEVSPGLLAALDAIQLPPRGSGPDHRFVAPDETSQRALAAADAAADAGVPLDASGPPVLSAAAAAQGKGASKSDLESEAELRVLLEVLDAYFSAAQSVAPEVDGIDEDGRTLLEALRASLREELDGPATITLNSAPPGRVPWEVLGVDEDVGAVAWGADLTDGRAVDPWRNAALSEDAKRALFAAHMADPAAWTPQALARAFRIRPQRAEAIVALKSLEKEQGLDVGFGGAKDGVAEGSVASASDPSSDPSTSSGASPSTGPGAERDLTEGFLTGSGERRLVTLPSYPNYRAVSLDAFSKRLEEAMGRSIEDISLDDLTEEVALQVLGAASKSAVEERLAEREEAQAVEEFSARLAYGLGRSGKGLQRGSRKAKAPSRPAEGWSLVVRPLGPSAAEEDGVFVAQPDGSRRELDDDEALMLRRQTPLPRRRVF